MADESDYSYSDDTFESTVPDEHPVYLYRSGRRESICLAESSASSESSSKIEELALSADCDEITEYSEEFHSEGSQTESSTEFVKKKLEILNSRKSNDCLTECEDVGSENKQPLSMETVAFCDKKIQQLQQGFLSGSSGNPWPFPHHANTKCSDEKRVDLVWHGSMANIESLKIENLLCKMAKSTSFAQHDPSNCASCRKQRSSIAEVDFLKMKLEVLKRPVFEATLENHLYARDGATLVADIINAGPKPSDPPGEIWDRLLGQTNKQTNNRTNK